MAVIDPTTRQNSENEQQPQNEARARRAQEDEMDVALLRQGGLYEVDSVTCTYEVDVLNETCSCPDHRNPDTPTPCKHLQRVQLELDARRIPRPDGRLPETASSTRTLYDASGAHLVATLRTKIREREEQIATLDAEIQALQFVCDVADVVGDGEEFDLKQILADEYGPASRL